MIFRLLHFAGIVFWVGSLVAIAVSAAHSEARVETMASLRRTTRWVTTPAMIVSFVGGLGMLLPAFTTLYAKAGWMHGKLTLLLILAGLTGVVSGRVRRAAQGQHVDAGVFSKLAAAVALIAATVIVLAVARPGG